LLGLSELVGFTVFVSIIVGFLTATLYLRTLALLPQQ
jgi:hypothetical protein